MIRAGPDYQVKGLRCWCWTLVNENCLLDIRMEKWTGARIYESGYVKKLCPRDGELGTAVVEMPVRATTLMRSSSEECGERREENQR